MMPTALPRSARLSVYVVTLWWARALAAVRRAPLTLARRAPRIGARLRPIVALVLEVASVAAAIRASFLLAPWLGWLALSAGLGVVGWWFDRDREQQA